MASTFKAPTGAKHDRCIDHVPHPFPKSGKLCIGPTIGRDGMIAFADEIAAKTAAHRAEDLARVEAMHLAARPGGRVKSSRHKHIGAVVENRGIAELAARFNARLGRTVEPDTYVAAVARKARVAKVAPVVEPEERPAGYTAEPEPVRRGPADAVVDMVRGPGWVLSRAEAVAAGLTPPVEPEPEPVADPVEPEELADMPGWPHDYGQPCACPGCVPIALPDPVEPADALAPVEPEPVADPSQCWTYLHTTGGTRRCIVEPDMHDGPHDYEPFVTSMSGEVVPVAPAPERTQRPARRVSGRKVVRCPRCNARRSARTIAYHRTVCTGPAAAVSVAPAGEPAPVAPVLAVVATSRPTCERCGQSFRKSGNGLAWHVANRPDCAERRLSVVA